MEELLYAVAVVALDERADEGLLHSLVGTDGELRLVASWVDLMVDGWLVVHYVH